MTDKRIVFLGNAWEQFKQVNDARLRDIERNGHADPLYDEHLNNISASLDNYKMRLDQIEIAHNHSSLSGEVDGSKPEQSSEYSKAFRNYVRKGLEGGLEQISIKALAVGSDPDGGYLVTPKMANQIMDDITESSPMRQLASVETISTDAMTLLDNSVPSPAGWTVETSGDLSETTMPPVARRSIPTHELYAQPKATQKLVDDSAVDIEVWLSGKIADIFGRTQNTAFINGNGVGQPRGVLTYAAGTNWGQLQQLGSGMAGKASAESFVSLYYSLKDDYCRRASFLMNRSMARQARLLKETDGHYIWQPGLTAGAPDTLLGVPVSTAANMPEPSPNSLAVAFGDFRAGYQIVDRQGIRILRDPFTEKPFVKFYTTTRVGGDVVDFDAIKLLRLAA